MIRQGDILLVPTAEPQGSFRHGVPKIGEITDRIVLAEGEFTGHAHVVTGIEVRAAIDGPRSLIHVLGGSLSHPDHDAVPRVIPDGWYEVVRQRVYTPSSPRWVQD